MGKVTLGFLFIKNIANFKAFWGVKNFSKNLFFLRSEPTVYINFLNNELLS